MANSLMGRCVATIQRWCCHGPLYWPRRSRGDRKEPMAGLRGRPNGGHCVLRETCVALRFASVRGQACEQRARPDPPSDPPRPLQRCLTSDGRGVSPDGGAGCRACRGCQPGAQRAARRLYKVGMGGVGCGLVQRPACGHSRVMQSRAGSPHAARESGDSGADSELVRWRCAERAARTRSAADGVGRGARPSGTEQGGPLTSQRAEE
jgi:hypothetical protein